MSDQDLPFKFDLGRLWVSGWGDETEALSACTRALDSLHPDQQCRVLSYLTGRYVQSQDTEENTK